MWHVDKVDGNYEFSTPDYGRASLMQAYVDFGVRQVKPTLALHLPLEDIRGGNRSVTSTALLGVF